MLLLFIGVFCVCYRTAINFFLLNGVVTFSFLFFSGITLTVTMMFRVILIFHILAFSLSV